MPSRSSLRTALTRFASSTISGRATFASTNSSTAVFGRTAKLHQMIDLRDMGKPGPSAALRERINALPPNTHFWVVADASALPSI